MVTTPSHSRPTIRTGLSFPLQVALLAARALRGVLRSPGTYLPGLVLSVFTLLIQEATLGNAIGFLPGLAGTSAVAFLVPSAVLNAALSGAGLAGQVIVQDLTTGYFAKLSLTPASRGALVLAAMLAGALVLGAQTVLVVLVGLLLGLQPAGGIGGVLAVVGLALLVGNALAGFTVAVGLRTGNPAATQGASFLFFPLTLLTTAFFPLSLLDGWLRVAAQLNPVTSILEAMRAFLIPGWGGPAEIASGVAVGAGLGMLTFLFALLSLQARNRQS